MKNCIPCNRPSDDEAATCLACGEASWSATPAETPKADEVVVTDDAEAATSGKKRSKKQ